MRLNSTAGRLSFLILIFSVVFLLHVSRLFYLQVIRGEYYSEKAQQQHERKSVLLAPRGKILVRKTPHTDETVVIATNNTTKSLYVDPLILRYPGYSAKIPLEEQEEGDPFLVAKILAPLLINAHCEKIEGCDLVTDPTKMDTVQKNLLTSYEKKLVEIFSKIEKQKVLIETDISESLQKEIGQIPESGIWFEENDLYANPVRIRNIKNTAKQLSEKLRLDKDILESALERKLIRYVKIEDRIVSEISGKIIALKQNEKYADILRGIGLRDEHWRYYPEKFLAAQVIGFVDNEGHGRYGIEQYFDDILRGKEGIISGATNTRGQRILNKDSTISQAEDGADIVLTIDRAVQSKVEQILELDRQEFQADFGQTIVIDPETGKIIAMANTPIFNPNDFNKTYEIYPITPEKEKADRESEHFNQRIPTIEQNGKLYRYFNTWGPQVLKNKTINEIYEPGSVMKAITMAAGINTREVSPYTTYNDTGPVEVDEFRIRNWDNTYRGTTSMREVIARSLNTGIAFLTQKMGPKILYEYLKNFGFGQPIEIPLDGVEDGTLENWISWSDSETVTRGFGQGVSATALQMAMAFSVLANGGYLMKPMLVEEIRHPDKTEKFEPKKIRRVISSESAVAMKNMLLHAADFGKVGVVRGYSVMAKSGTSQTYKNGKPQEGLGTTITSFASFGPYENPRFVVLVKFDYPRTSIWGSETAAKTAQKINKFLFDYYEIPPDR